MKWLELFDVLKSSDHVFAFSGKGNVGTGCKLPVTMLLGAVRTKIVEEEAARKVLNAILYGSDSDYIDLDFVDGC